MLSPKTLPALQSALKDAGLDGWLLYDFRGLNPVAGSLCRARLEAHAAVCTPCSQRLAAARSRKHRLRAIGDAERAPASLHDAVMAALRGVRGSRTS